MLWSYKTLTIQTTTPQLIQPSEPISKTIFQGTLESRQCCGQQSKHWKVSVKEWTPLPTPKLLRRVSCRNDWKRISAGSSLMSPTPPPQQPDRSKDWPDLNLLIHPLHNSLCREVQTWLILWNYLLLLISLMQPSKPIKLSSLKESMKTGSDCGDIYDSSSVLYNRVKLLTSLPLSNSLQRNTLHWFYEDIYHWLSVLYNYMKMNNHSSPKQSTD